MTAADDPVSPAPASPDEPLEAQFGPHRFYAGEGGGSEEFRGARFDVADLRGARFTDCDLTGVTIRDAMKAVTELLDLTGKVAIVTGGAAGIGLGITRRQGAVRRGAAGSPRQARR